MSRILVTLAITFCIFLHNYFSCFFAASPPKNTLGVNETIALYYGDFLESSNQRFRLAIINPSNWTYFLAIQYVYMNLPINIWAANNYEKPAREKPAYLTMTPDGRLVVDDFNVSQLFVVNDEQQSGMISNTTAALLDNGNLVLTGPGGNTVWQSFDHPSEKWLQGMKIGIFEQNMGTNQRKIFLTSLLTSGEPNSTLALDQNSTKELIVMQNGVVYWRSGTWDGLKFSSFDFSANFSVTFSYFSNANESFFTWNSSTDPFAFLWFSPTGNITVVSGDLMAYKSTAVCDEIDEKKGKEQSIGCTNPCGVEDGFKKILGDLDVWDDSIDSNQTFAACKLKCRTDCLCFAYSHITYNPGGWGCKTTRSRKGLLLSSGTQRIYVRDSFDLAGREINSPSRGSRARAPPTSTALAPGPVSVINDPVPSRRKKSKNWKVKLSIGVLVTFLGVVILLYLVCCLKCKIENIKGLRRFSVAKVLPVLRDKRVDGELPFFGLTSLQIATNNFSDENLLGQGGFGPVYKGKLQDGQEIAVKRLNHMSGSGIEQFKNEVTVISKLQHRNLVRLLGYCIHKDERILVYEYLPNKSLDSIVFDSEKRMALDWKRRLHIIEGIAQGLLYLHKYSRLKIIHRDLKASNVLLDNDLNPKISDFGTARIFGDNESRSNTKNVIGTYGYMSPEYAMNGVFSIKSDVYSFGVMMLEIINGKKNTSFSDSDDHLNLIGYVWDLWVQGRVTEVADCSLSETICQHEITRYVQIGLLCVQENAADRPTMSDVVSMLNNESITGLRVPNRPAFSAIISRLNQVQNQEPCSINNVTISDVEGR